MADTAEYELTERAGPRVAGRVVVKGQTLTLTAAEAEHGLREGTIVPKGKTLPKVFTLGSKRLDRMREEAVALRTRAALLASEVEEAHASPGEPAGAEAETAP
ncbi:hypothetical protein [Methylobacterium iners]|uniref:Uncharacterized protein n=1 Tax=Methylobacterium iners TaxID=418707 RepID=A0ABQ4RUR5_9HYPH|nr:hypothetical protein [Methylobacterium iners]GJD93357.1 hypothetical protein OCOJLMKI_0550 [Methylobacterium iners]